MNKNTTTTSLASAPSLIRRPSPSSRPSYAASFAEQGDGFFAGAEPPAENVRIEEEIAEIKRYEVSHGMPHLTQTRACDFVQGNLED